MVAPARRSIGSACFDRLGAFISPRQAYNKSVDNKAIPGQPATVLIRHHR